MKFWCEIILVISNRTRTVHSFDFEITRMISAQIALHSVQLPLLISLMGDQVNYILTQSRSSDPIPLPRREVRKIITGLYGLMGSQVNFMVTRSKSSHPPPSTKRPLPTGSYLFSGFNFNIVHFRSE